MDFWIRIGLLAVWVVFGVALLVWWRRRHSSRHYPYSERANVILEALKKNADLGLVYWSKSKRRFQRRIATPLELDGYSMKAFDHTLNDVRIFKVTRIRQAAVIPRGSRSMPRMRTSTVANWIVAGCGVLAAAFLVFVLVRGHGSQTQSAAVAPLPAPPPLPATSSVEAAEVPAPVVKREEERWEVIVENHEAYDDRRLAALLVGTLRCTPLEAEEFVRQIRLEGKAPVWRGPWFRAERLRQFLETQDIVAYLQREKPAQ